MTGSLTELPNQAPDGIPAYPMPRAQRCPLDPPPALSALRSNGPLHRVRLRDGSTPWLVTRYAEQRALLSDPRVSADAAREGYPSRSEAFRARRNPVLGFISMDNPGHARLRHMVTSAFTVRRIEEMRPGIQHLVDELIDDMLAGPNPADLVTAFALPVPSLVICQLLGVPYADHPDGGLLSRVAAEQVAIGELSRPELATIGLLLLIAGHETTANMIALGTYALLSYPDQLAAVRSSDDPELIRSTVEELLRNLSVVHLGRRRVAVEDIEVAGQVIRAGEGIVLPNGIANRDAEMYPYPADADSMKAGSRQDVVDGRLGWAGRQSGQGRWR
jgi:cytochrome P450